MIVIVTEGHVGGDGTRKPDDGFDSCDTIPSLPVVVVVVVLVVVVVVVVVAGSICGL